MMREREKATTDAQRAEIDNAIQNRTNQYNKDVRNIGGVDYDAMLAEYGTFEERKQAIIDDYDEKRRAAQEAGNTEMVEAIDRAQAQALSKFALDELQAHPDWELMFGDLDEISTKKLQELIDKINNLDGVYLGIEFDPKDLETLKGNIEKMKKEIQERNPFSSLVSSIKDYIKAEDEASKKTALTNVFKSASGAIELVGGAFDAVTSGLEKWVSRWMSKRKPLSVTLAAYWMERVRLQAVSQRATPCQSFKGRSGCFHPLSTFSTAVTERRKIHQTPPRSNRQAESVL